MSTLPAELVVKPDSTTTTSTTTSTKERGLLGGRHHQRQQRQEEEQQRQRGNNKKNEQEEGEGVQLREVGLPNASVSVDARTAAAWKNLPKDMIAGAVLGGVAHTLVAPVERAKLLLQTQDSNMVVRDGRHPRYKGLVDCIVRVARDEGVLSLWRGNGSSVMRYYPSVAINFACKDFYRTLLTEVDGIGAGDKAAPPAHFALARAPANFLAGAMAGCTSLLFVYPLDIAHTRLAADIGRGTSRQFQGIKDFLKTIYSKDGLRGLYRGFPASLQGMVVHRSVYFGAFDTGKDYLSREVVSEQIPFWKRWVVAQVATTSAGLISYPMDTVRRRMMMQAGLEKQMYLGTLDCWKKIHKTEGLFAFYKGALTNMVRGTGAALILVLYDEVKNFMHGTVPAGLDGRPPTPLRPQ